MKVRKLLGHTVYYWYFKNKELPFVATKCKRAKM